MVNKRDIEILEKNIRESFRLAKTDILRLEQAIDDINKKLHDLEEKHFDNKEKIDRIVRGGEKFYTVVKKAKRVKMKPRKYKKIKKIKKGKLKNARKPDKHKFVAAEDGKKFHIIDCIFGKNIKPKKRVYFASKTKALNNGLKPCKCILK